MGIAHCFTKGADSVESVEDIAMSENKTLSEQFHEEGKVLEVLIRRSMQQGRDIERAKKALDQLREDIE